MAAPSTPQNVEVKSDSSEFVLIHGEVPFLVPVDASDDDGKLSVSWDAVSGSEYYEYRVCEAGTCGDWEWSDVTSIAVQVNNTGDFTVQVRACDNTGCSGGDESESIYVTGVPSAGRNTETVSTIPQPDAISDSVGAVAGEFRVNESGQATYNIPIYTPKGRGGVQPQVALSYTSQGAKGILGVGWSVSAGSAITRCRQTSEVDGVDKGVDLTYSDRFCLDGQRLILVSGTYGHSNSTYRTEIASQTKVIAKGTSGNGPSYFEVYRKDGSKSLYGYTSSSKLKANKLTSIDNGIPQTSVLATVLTWAQSSYTDNSSLARKNTINFIYTKNDNYGEQYLDHISYPPNNRIEFNYTDRPYLKTNMSLGGVSRLRKYLTGITVKDNNNEVRKYEFDYLTEEVDIVLPPRDQDDGTMIPKSQMSGSYKSYSGSMKLNPSPGTQTQLLYPLRLTAVRELGKNIKSNSWVSKEPTTFSWQASSKGYVAGTTKYRIGDSKYTRVNSRNYQFADVNGDSKSDFVYVLNNNGLAFQVMKSTGSGFTKLLCRTTIGNQPDDEVTWSFIDYNADGINDLFTSDRNYSTNKYEFKVFLGHSSGCFGSAIKMPFVSSTHKSSRPVDYNADGLPDVIYKDGGWKVKFMKRTGNSNLPYGWTSSHPIKFNDGYTGSGNTSYSFDFGDMKVADFNGDGRVDPVVEVTKTVTTPPSDCGPGDGTIEPKQRRGNLKAGGTTQKINYCPPYVTKYNDSLVAEGLDASGHFVLRTYSRVHYAGIKKDGDGNAISQFIDINGDGLADHVYKNSNDNYWYYALSTGKDFLTAKKITQLGTDKYPSYTDFDRDGRLDIAYTKSGELYILSGSEFGFVGSEASTDIPVHWDFGHGFSDINGDGLPEYIEVDMHGDVHELTVNRTVNSFVNENVIRRIDNGMGSLTDITFTTLTDENNPSLYTAGTNAALLDWGAHPECYDLNREDRNVCSPVFDLNGPMYVVSKVKSSSPSKSDPDGAVAVSYRYGEARMQSKGRGFLGFGWLETKDLQTNIVTRTEYRQDYPFIGSPKRTTKKLGSQLLSDAYNQWSQKNITFSNGNEVKFPYIYRSAETQWNLNSSGSKTFSSQTLSQSEYDNYANVTKQITIQNDSKLYNPGDTSILSLSSATGLTKVVTHNTYNDNVSNWRLGRLETATVRHERRGQTSITRRSDFEYYPGTGFLKKEIVEPNSFDVKERLTTEYFYDSYGNVTKKHTYSINPNNCSSTTSSGEGCEYYVNRMTESIYGSQGRYVNKTKNVYGQITQQVFLRDHLGQPIKSRSLSGVTTLNGYGAFGHKYFTFNSAGNSSTETKFYCGNNCPSIAVYGVKTETATGQKSFVYYDALGREVQKAVRSFDGRYSVTTTEYNRRGLAVKATEPEFLSVPYGTVSGLYYTATEYDVLGRPETITNPDSNSTTITYTGNDVVTINPLGQYKTEKKDSSGKTVEVIDDLGNSLYYEYNATGDLLTLKFGSELQSEMTYDSLGRKISMWDADKGGADGKSWSYSYNALGELVAQTDAKGQKVITYRDRLGRTIKRLDINASGTVTADQRWTYNNTASLTEYGYDVGKLTKEIAHVSGYEVNYNYDDIGRLDQTLTYIDDELYITETIFDSYGRVSRQYDAASSEFANAGVQNVYNQYGFLKSVHETTGSPKPSNRIRLIEAMDARGNVTIETKGANAKTTRTYYPDTGRLKTISTEANSQQVQLLEYYWDALGNLKWRETKDTVSNSMIRENFTYDSLNRLETASHPNENMNISYYDNGNIHTKSGVGTYSYGGTCNGVKAGPHAVTQAGNNSYCYDENGNMLSGDGRTMSYSTFDKMVRVDKGGHTTKFAYAPSRSRYKRIDIADGKTTTTFYVGNVEIIKHSDKSYTTYRRNLGGVIIEEATDGSKKTHYLHTDHLGSTDVITNASGTLVQQFSFNAFGERRDPVNWDTYISSGFMSLSPMSASITSRGYTGHEQMDEVGLIHMNGRVYDPKLGRFLQADPHIQAPSDSQNLNRYSYVNNNPLSYTDPTGYFFKKIHKALKSITRGVMKAIGYEASSWLIKIGSLFCGPWAPACAAAGTYDLNRAFGASPGDSLKAGAIAGIATYAFQQANGSANLTTEQIIADGVITAASYKDPKLGQALNYLYNGFDPSSAGDSARNLVSAYGKVKASEEFERFARKNGMTLQELNLYMQGASLLGNKLVGTRYTDNFNNEGKQGIYGILSREEGGWINVKDNLTLNRSIGLVFDTIDIALGYQGILTGSGYDFIRNGQTGGKASLRAHSLGTLDATNLVARGWVGSAHIDSLPFGNIAPAGVETHLGALDLVNGGALGYLLNPWATVLTNQTSTYGAYCHTIAGCYGAH